ncbi:cytochrome c oxidase subunit 4 [soil metagenome]
MKANATLFWVLAGFLLLADAAYTVWSVLDSTHGTATSHDGGGISGVDWIGTIGIGLTAVLSAFIATFLTFQYRAQGGELPEDRLEANIEDGDAEQGHYAPWSWWPVMLAGSLALVFLGVAVGFWISAIGGGILVVSIIGWQYEFYRGFHAH